MSEKVKIIKCLDTGRKAKDNNPVYDIELATEDVMNCASVFLNYLNPKE